MMMALLVASIKIDIWDKKFYFHGQKINLWNHTKRVQRQPLCSVDVHAARGVSTSKTISVSEVILGSSGVPQ